MLPLTLFLVQRPRYKTVTGIPILIPCDARDQEGVATWLGDVRETYQHVRVVTQADLKPKLRKNPLLSVTESDKEFFLALVALLKGMEEKDRLAIVRARERVIVALGRKQGLGLDSDWVQRTASELGLKPGQEAKALELATLGPGQAVDISWLYSAVVSNELDGVRLVLWWSANQFKPALYCPDLKSALFTFILMRIVAGKGWGVCPQCGNFFVQRRSDQAYCMIAHREAHRVARWRAAKVAHSKNKGGHNGPRKAR